MQTQFLRIRSNIGGGYGIEPRMTDTVRKTDPRLKAETGQLAFVETQDASGTLPPEKLEARARSVPDADLRLLLIDAGGLSSRRKRS